VLVTGEPFEQVFILYVGKASSISKEHCHLHHPGKLRQHRQIYTMKEKNTTTSEKASVTRSGLKKPTNRGPVVPCKVRSIVHCMHATMQRFEMH
jgi:hypothetical protein